MPAAPTPIDQRVRLTFASKRPYATNWLEIVAPADAEPTELYAELAAIGWTEEIGAGRPYAAYDETTFADLGYQAVDHVFSRRGTEHFGMWSKAESKTFMAQARAVLARYGFSHITVWRKTLEDML